MNTKPNHFDNSQQIDGIKNAFGVDNAKQMNVTETVQMFVPQTNFHRLIVKKNQILLGSRGSGKTTWIRMLAHDHVCLAATDPTARTDYARKAMSANLIGVYVPASAAFTGDLKNKGWQTEEEAEQYFVWRLNLHICSALTHIIHSCIDQYEPNLSERPIIIRTLCRILSQTWTNYEITADTVEELRLALTSAELKHQKETRKRRMSSNRIPPYEDHFDNDLMLPFKNSINIIKTKIKIPEDAVWMICLDEIEYLSELHHRILNSQIRTSSSDIIFKIATMPFAHHTLATNLGDPVREGNDFEYVNVDQEPIDGRGGQVEGEFLRFARAMFKRRIAMKLPNLKNLDLKSLLGYSPLLDNKRVETPIETANFIALLRRHANPKTIERAEHLANRDKERFKNEIVRKMHGALLLREAIKNHKGNSKIDIYCGEAVVVRCCDGNARRLMRIINQLVQKIEIEGNGLPKLPINPSSQNQILESMARDTLSRVQSEPPNGAIAATYLNAVGKYFERKFLSSSTLLGSDQVSSIQIVESDGDDAQRFIKQAVQLSLMTPAKDVTLTANNTPCIGVFHLAFIFSSLFKLPPRRNDSIRLSKILSDRSNSPFKNSEQQSLI